MSEEQESEQEQGLGAELGYGVAEGAGCCLLEAAAGAFGVVLLLALPFSPFS